MPPRRGLLIPSSFDLRTARQSLQQLKTEGKKAGTETGLELMKGLRSEMQAKIGTAREALHRGLIKPEDFQKIRREARITFNEGITRELDRMRRAGQQNTAEFARMQRSIQNVGAAKRGLRGEVGLLDRGFMGLVRNTKLWLSAMAAGALYTIARGIRSILGEVTSLDAALTQSLAIMGLVPAHLSRQMHEAATRASRELNLSATELGKAFYFLASAGLEAEQQIAALPTVAAFAKAGMFDLQVATDLLTDAQSALGLVSKDAQQNLIGMQRVADVLVKANTMANASVQQFAESLTTRAAAALRIVNKDVEEGVAVLAAMADQGTKGAEAGTQLSIVLRDLQRRALENREAFAAAGVQVFDATGKMRNMADIIGQLEQRLDGMSDAQKRAEITQLGFADRSVASLLMLIGLSDRIREYERGLRDAGGTMQDVAQKQLKSFEERLGLVGQQWAEVKRRMAETIALPVAEFFVGVAAAILSTESPLDRLLARMRRLGAHQDLLRPLEIRRDIDAMREEIEQAEQDIQRMRTGVPRVLSSAGGRSTPLGIQLAQPLDAAQDKIVDLESALRALAAAEKEQREAAAAGDIVVADSAAARAEALRKLVEREQELAAMRQDMRDAEAQIPEAERRAAVRREIADIDQQIRELSTTESAATSQLILNLEARRKALLETVEPPEPEPVPTDDWDDDGLSNAEREARAKERLRIETELQDRLFALTATAHQEALRQLDKLVEAYRKAGGTITAGMKAQVDALRDNIRLGEVLETAQRDLAHLDRILSVAGAGPEALAALEAFRQGILEQGDAIDENHNRWKEFNELLKQVDSLEFRTLSAAGVGPEAMAALDAFRQRVLEQRDAIDKTHDRWKEFDEILKQVDARLLATQADAAAFELVDAFNRQMMELREQLARDVIDQKEFERQGRVAGEALKKGILAVMDRLAESGLLTEDLRAALLGLIPTSTDESRLQDERIRKLREQARTLEENARAAVQLAEAFGLIDGEAAKVLQTLAQLGASVARIAGGDLSAIPSALAAAASLGGRIFGGPSQQERDRAAFRQVDAMVSLERALRALERAVIRDMSVREKETAITDVSEFERIIAAVQRVIDKLPTAFRPQSIQLGQLPPETLAALREIQEATGIQFLKDGRLFIKEFQAAVEAFRSLELGSFAADVGGQLDALAFLLGILGDAAGDAEDRLERFLAAIEAFAPEFAAELRDLALEDPEAAREWIRTLAEAFAAGGITDPLIQAIFGPGRTADEILRILQESNRFLEDLAAAADTGATRAWTKDFTITEVTGTRMVGALVTSNLLLGDIRTDVRAILEALGRSAPDFAAFTPPSPTDLMGAMQAPGGTHQTINNIELGPVELNLDARELTPSNAREVGEEFGRGAARKIDELLGRQTLAQQRVQGRSVRRLYGDR